MKNLKAIALILGVGVISILSSCSSDDSGDVVNNVITFDGNTYTMVAGVVEDYGAFNPEDDAETDSHYNYDFTIADAAFVMEVDEFNDVEYEAPGATFGVYVELFSSGASDFQTGTFTFIGHEESDAGAGAGTSFFSAAEAYIPTGGTDSDGDPEFIEHEATGGSVTVSGSGPTDFTITYNLQFSGGRTLTGTYNAGFVFSDETDAD